MQGNINLYAIPVTQKKVGQTPVFRHPDSKQQLSTAPKNIKSLAELWDNSLKKFQNKKLIEEMTYKQTDDILKRVGSWFIDNKIEKIYLYAKNSPQWTITDLASWNYGLITIPLYDTLGNQAFDHIIQKADGTAIQTSQAQGEKLLHHLKREKGQINTIIFTDNIPANLKDQYTNLGIKLFTFDEIKQNKKVLQKPDTNWDSHITYIYTSGTTGIPKGVIYTHQMILTQLFALFNHFQLKQTDVHMSFLPIAHAYQRFMIWDCIFSGANIRYSRHPITEITKDFAAIKPTIAPMVPRLLNKFYPPMKQLSQTQNGKIKVKHVFGGNIRLLATGSAPVSAEILAFFKQVLECDIRQGYGQTESCTVTFVTFENQTNFGHVGGPNKSVQYKLVDVPQMNYTSQTNPPRGQVCFRGKSLFKQYYKNPQATKQTIDSQGWVHTGDIGIILPGGALQLIDRKKNIFKLSQGQYIAPEKIENIYMRCKYVASCFVYGQSLQNYLLGFVNPTSELLPGIAKQLNIAQTDPVKLCENAEVNKFILQQMDKQAEKDKLNGLQRIKKLKLVATPFMNSGIFTSTLKLQRHIAKNVFEEDIKKMYKQ